jgi:MFS superfamily sulfate permease-like transporter
MKSINTPLDGLAGLKQNWKSDINSGFLVFLIALPLCLGISRASGFPPIAGIYTAIIGGIIVSFFSGAPMTIKGPAAGLIVIALGSVQELGQGNMLEGYRLTLAVIVVSGLIQVGFGLLRTGKYGDFFPATAVHGMLASIGIIILSKQIHVAMGVNPTSKDTIGLLAEIPTSFMNLNPHIAIIGFTSLSILFILPKLNISLLKKIPTPIIVLFVAVPLGILFKLDDVSGFIIKHNLTETKPEDLLVVLPQNIFAGITFPDFSQITSLTSIKYIIMFALVGNIESLLSAKAIDTLDPYKRKSAYNKDLIAVGIGNTIAGFIGGLPMISEIVRSSANINNGAQTRWSNFFHGCFLLVFVAIASSLIQYIPNAALAAMLMYTGYRLASPREFYKTYKIGSDQLIIFVVTIITTLATDLLIGIAFGIVAEFIIHLVGGVPMRALFKSQVEIIDDDSEIAIVKVKDAAIFSNFLGFKKQLDAIDHDKNLVIDMANARVVDHSFMQHLNTFEDEFRSKGRELEVIGLEYHKPFSDHPLAARKVSNLKNDIIEFKLNNRQIEIRDLAMQLKMAFIPQRIKASRKVNGFIFMKGRTIIHEENLLIENSSLAKFEYSDVQIQEKGSIEKTRFRKSLIYISDLDFKLPQFMLKQEGYLERLLEMTGLQEIQLKDYPVFTQKFILKCRDEFETRKFFTSDIIQVFEEMPEYSIESTNNALVIYKENKLLSAEEIKITYELVIRLLEVIKKKNQITLEL